MADEFSTPIQKLQGISTREENGQNEPVSYEDILRQQAQPDTQPMQQPMQQMQQMPQMQPVQMPQMQMQPTQHMQHMSPGGYAQSEYDDDDEYERPVRPRREARDDTPPASKGPWLLTKLKRHKNDIIFALAMFATLTVIIPRLRRMPRFSEGIPMIVMGIVSVIMGCLANTVSMSV